MSRDIDETDDEDLADIVFCDSFFDWATGAALPPVLRSELETMMVARDAFNEPFAEKLHTEWQTNAYIADSVEFDEAVYRAVRGVVTAQSDVRELLIGNAVDACRRAGDYFRKRVDGTIGPRVEDLPRLESEARAEAERRGEQRRSTARGPRAARKAEAP